MLLKTSCMRIISKKHHFLELTQREHDAQRCWQQIRVWYSVYYTRAAVRSTYLKNWASKLAFSLLRQGAETLLRDRTLHRSHALNTWAMSMATLLTCKSKQTTLFYVSRVYLVLVTMVYGCRPYSPTSSPQLFIEPEVGVITLLPNNQEWYLITLIGLITLIIIYFNPNSLKMNLINIFLINNFKKY